MNLSLEASKVEWSFPFCPQPGAWSLDWNGIVAEFPHIAAMDKCPQDPRWHAEGDVLIHTRMVCEALVQQKDWRELPATERSIVFAATLFHDAGKPLTTKIGEDGRITSKGHAARGTQAIRALLYRECGAPFSCREAVCALIRHHGLPLGFLDKPSPERAVILASLVTRGDWVALVALADVLGRTCSDKQQLLDRVALFEDLCAENRCLTTPRPFSSDHSRFVYCQSGTSGPDYEAYDDTRFEAVILSGLPGAGKDRWIHQNRADLPVISLDEIRAELDVDPTDEQGDVASMATERVREFARASQSFVWNATNVSRAMRDRLVRLVSAYHGSIRIVYVETEYEKLLSRNWTRTHPVPAAVVERLIDKLEVPDMTEAHTVLWAGDS